MQYSELLYLGTNLYQIEISLDGRRAFVSQSKGPATIFYISINDNCLTLLNKTSFGDELYGLQIIGDNSLLVGSKNSIYRFDFQCKHLYLHSSVYNSIESDTYYSISINPHNKWQGFFTSKLTNSFFHFEFNGISLNPTGNDFQIKNNPRELQFNKKGDKIIAVTEDGVLNLITICKNHTCSNDTCYKVLECSKCFPNKTYDMQG